MPTRFAVLGRTPACQRAIARVAACAGAQLTTIDPAELPRELAAGPLLLCAGLAELSPLLPRLDELTGLEVLLLCDRSLGDHLASPAWRARISHHLGLRYPEAPPRAWELLGIVRRHVSGEPLPESFGLDAGASSLEWSPSTSGERDATVAAIESACTGVAGEQTGSAFATVAHELLMNAMYDAPAGPDGKPLFAADRTATVRLAPEQTPRIRWACDGSRLVLRVTDPFGRLRREHVFEALRRAVVEKVMARSGGGAGLGLSVVCRASTCLVFEVVPGRRTAVTAILELDVPPRELRGLPRSIHFFADPPRAAG